MRGNYGGLAVGDRGVGSFRAFVSKENLEFVSRLSAAAAKRETQLCTELLNDRLDDLRRVYEQLLPKMDVDADEIDQMFLRIGM